MIPSVIYKNKNEDFSRNNNTFMVINLIFFGNLPFFLMIFNSSIVLELVKFSFSCKQDFETCQSNEECCSMICQINAKSSSYRRVFGVCQQKKVNLIKSDSTVSTCLSYSICQVFMHKIWCEEQCNKYGNGIIFPIFGLLILFFVIILTFFFMILIYMCLAMKQKRNEIFIQI